MRITELCEARQETILFYRRIGGQQQEDVEVSKAMKDYFPLWIASFFLQRNLTCLHDRGSRIADLKWIFRRPGKRLQPGKWRFWISIFSRKSIWPILRNGIVFAHLIFNLFSQAWKVAPYFTVQGSMWYFQDIFFSPLWIVMKLRRTQNDTILSYRRIGGEQQEDVEVSKAMKDYFQVRISSFLFFTTQPNMFARPWKPNRGLQKWIFRRLQPSQWRYWLLIFSRRRVGRLKTEDMEILKRGKNRFAFRTALSLFFKTNMVLKYYSRTVNGFCATQEKAAPR